MAVLLTVSKTLTPVAISDTLQGGGTGIDVGVVTNQSYAPRIDKNSNTGALDLFISHDAVDDPITDVSTAIQQYGLDTGFTYGGKNTAADDFTTLKNLANASGDSKNNADGLSGGLWLDMNANVPTANQFDYAANGLDSGGSQGGDDTVRKYGDNLTDGVNPSSAFAMNTKAMVIDSDQGQGGDGTNGYIPTAPVEGSIGKDGDTALGDNGHVKLRMYIPSVFNESGIHQWEWVIYYSFTS